MGIKVFNPTISFDFNDYMWGGEPFVDQNTYYLKTCDVILANLEDLDKSYGTIYELITAYHLRKPVVTFGECPINHPHIKATLGTNLKNVEEAIDFILDVYGQ